ncbi:MAG: cupin domain-containing protein [Henriciella sp.]
MQVTLFDTAVPYDAAKHFDMTAMRLQGGDVTDSKDFWVGLSTFLPGGGAEWGSSPTGKVYVVVEGRITVTTKDDEAELGPMDSVFIAANEERSVLNKTNRAATMIVVSP